MEAESPVSAKSCAFMSTGELTADVELVAATGVDVAYDSLLSGVSFVVHVICVELRAVLVAESPDITGAVVSPGGGGVCPLHFPISSPCLM